ncbi:hypothetical protein PRO82_000537 [Candidatus Protochlamydia amoebophila]|nr:hypothetical protein [Candidatus Protochlamydia amoebophila]
MLTIVILFIDRMIQYLNPFMNKFGRHLGKEFLNLRSY